MRCRDVLKSLFLLGLCGESFAGPWSGGLHRLGMCAMPESKFWPHLCQRTQAGHCEWNQLNSVNPLPFGNLPPFYNMKKIFRWMYSCSCVPLVHSRLFRTFQICLLIFSQKRHGFVLELIRRFQSCSVPWKFGMTVRKLDLAHMEFFNAVHLIE